MSMQSPPPLRSLHDAYVAFMRCDLLRGVFELGLEQLRATSMDSFAVHDVGDGCLCFAGVRSVEIWEMDTPDTVSTADFRLVETKVPISSIIDGAAAIDRASVIVTPFAEIEIEAATAHLRRAACRGLAARGEQDRTRQLGLSFDEWRSAVAEEICWDIRAGRMEIRFALEPEGVGRGRYSLVAERVRKVSLHRLAHPYEVTFASASLSADAGRRRPGAPEVTTLVPPWQFFELGLGPSRVRWYAERCWVERDDDAGQSEKVHPGDRSRGG